MNAVGYVAGGLLVAAMVGVWWWLARPLRARPRPPTEVSEARFRRLAPVVVALMVAAGAMLVVGMVVSALS